MLFIGHATTPDSAVTRCTHDARGHKRPSTDPIIAASDVSTPLQASIAERCTRHALLMGCKRAFPPLFSLRKLHLVGLRPAYLPLVPLLCSVEAIDRALEQRDIGPSHRVLLQLRFEHARSSALARQLWFVPPTLRPARVHATAQHSQHQVAPSGPGWESEVTAARAGDRGPAAHAAPRSHCSIPPLNGRSGLRGFSSCGGGTAPFWMRRDAHSARP